MGTPYLGEIRPFAFGFAPRDWALCQGQLLQINSNQALFSVLGTTYGGNGINTFALPDLRGRVSLSSGSDPNGAAYQIGGFAGEETHALTIQEMPGHTHTLNGSNAASGSQSVPSGSVALGVTSGSSGTLALYGPAPANGVLASQAIGANGSGQGHPNLMPFLCVNFCISLQGVYPTRN